MKNNPILLCFGTRPEWLKIKPLIKIMDRSEYKLLFTGQHPDLLQNVEVDYKININDSDNRLDSIISDCMLQFPKGEFGSVLVQGDTGSAFGCALAAFNRQLKIYYLEAGLRSGNLQHPYPEEGYRQMIARISDVNLTPTQLSADNLLNEKVHGKSYVVGNSVLDNLVDYGEPTYENYVLITLHRRENHYWMDKWFIELNKEGSFFNKQVIVCRTTTERPEGLDTGHLHLCKTPNDLNDLFGKVNNYPYISENCPYGDGYTSIKVLNILRDEEF